ncbi:MAG: helix-turn-helix transcriptional regulator [Ruminococcaceae bacterium]|nr:helix-turn-helix transcriptional regulator [Oscillospiraceae bacterium]
MLIFDLKAVGNRLYDLRTKKLMTRADIAEKAELSDRAYADIERGNVNMRLETLLRICAALGVTPNDVLTVEEPCAFTEPVLVERMRNCSDAEKNTALKLLNVYIDSIK